ncbi:MAG: UDP-N-acetylmuramoyl-tripeptide--D-alanyl-D-alanine ligase [Syntrophomonas sp.]
MKLSLQYICSSLGGVLLQGNPELLIEAISTDSRRIPPNAVFFALSGERFDGHDYLEQAFAAGAAAVCITGASKAPSTWPDRGIIKVADTVQALQDLASDYRKHLSIPVVGVTGSVGKTNTKELVALCLEGSFSTFKSSGNYNNDIGLPLSLLSIGSEHQAAVVEMAMRGLGEIRRLARIARPNYAVITNVEPVHLETLGTIENIARAKCEILEEIEEGGLALINGDNPVLVETSRNYPVKKFYFGHNPSCDLRILSVGYNKEGIDIEAIMFDKREIIYCPLPSRRLAGNAVAAVAVAALMGVGLDKCQEQLLKYVPGDRRLNLKRNQAGGVIIDDTYNANPLSMIAALECGLETAAPGKYIAVLGDMFELGDSEQEGHQEVGRRAAACKVDILVAVGERAAYIAAGAREYGLPENKVHHFLSKADVLDYLKQVINPQDKVLFKASRGMEMETLIKGLEEKTD